MKKKWRKWKKWRKIIDFWREFFLLDWLESVHSRIIYELDPKDPIIQVLPIQNILWKLPVVPAGKLELFWLFWLFFWATIISIISIIFWPFNYFNYLYNPVLKKQHKNDTPMNSLMKKRALLLRNAALCKGFLRLLPWLIMKKKINEIQLMFVQAK